MQLPDDKFKKLVADIAHKIKKDNESREMTVQVPMDTDTETDSQTHANLKGLIIASFSPIFNDAEADDSETEISTDSDDRDLGFSDGDEERHLKRIVWIL